MKLGWGLPKENLAGARGERSVPLRGRPRPSSKNSGWSRVFARSCVRDPQRIEAQDFLRRAGLSPRCAVRIRPNASQLAHSQQHPRSSTFAGLLLSDACLAAHRSPTRFMRAADRFLRREVAAAQKSAPPGAGSSARMTPRKDSGRLRRLPPSPLAITRQAGSRPGGLSGAVAHPRIPPATTATTTCGWQAGKKKKNQECKNIPP